jgi:Tfp pilus assembly protein PilV
MNSSESGARTQRGGFTLLEVVMSMVIMTYGVLALAGTTIHVIRQVNIAEFGTARTAVIQSVVERVRAEGFDSYQDYADTMGVYTVEWETWRIDSRTKGLRVVSSGPGLDRSDGAVVVAQNVLDTLDYLMVRP